jgi:hypothetical protein
LFSDLEFDLSVEDAPTLRQYECTAFRTGFAELFKNSKKLMGNYSEDMKISPIAERELVHVARNLSNIRTFPLLRDVIVRFGGNEELANVKYHYLIKIVDLPYVVYSWLNNYKIPKSRAEAVYFTKSVIKKAPHESLAPLLKAKKSFKNKVSFMRPTKHENVMLDGITWYESVVEELLPLVHNKAVDESSIRQN